MNIVHVTNEPNVENTDGCALTIYTDELGTTDKVKEALINNQIKPTGYYRSGILMVDTSSEWFEVCEIECPFSGCKRFQAHPTG